MPAQPQRQYSAAELPEIVKADQVEIHYVGSNATLHAAGCQHRSDQPPVPADIPTFGADDWFYVAPCAKKRTKSS